MLTLGTKVLTDHPDTYTFVQDLSVGDMVQHPLGNNHIQISDILVATSMLSTVKILPGTIEFPKLKEPLIVCGSQMMMCKREGFRQGLSYIEEVMADDLVNGATILRCPPMEPTSFYSIQLQNGSVLEAQGAVCCVSTPSAFKTNVNEGPMFSPYGIKSEAFSQKTWRKASRYSN